MTLLFVHDHPFYRIENNVYTGGAFPSLLWNNYLLNFRRVIVFGRNAQSEKSKVALSSGDTNVSFYLTDNYNSIVELVKYKKKLHNELTILIDQADAVLVRLPSVLGFIAAEIAIKRKKKVWVEQVGNAQEALSSYGSILGTLAARAFEFENRRIVNRASFISYVTQSKLQKDYPCNSNAIQVSLSDVLIKKVLNASEINVERFTSDTLKIGLIGGFDTKYKGQDILLKAVSLLPETIQSKIELYFVGKGNFEWILRYAEELNLVKNIKFFGSKESGNEIIVFLSKLSLYVQPSLTEGMPRAVIEAMSTGTPVASSAVGGLPDIVNPSFLHDRSDFKKLSKDIQFFYNNREVLKEESLKSIEKAMPYLLENLHQKRMNFYNQMNKVINNEK